MNIIKKIITNKWVLSFGVTFLLMLIYVVLFHPVFMTVDDAKMKYVLAGYLTGAPSSTYIFCKWPLSNIISFLYTYFPRIQWYALYHFCVIGFSVSLIVKNIYVVFERKLIKMYYAVVVHIVLYCTIYSISTLLMHFEITACLAATSAIVLLQGVKLEGESTKTNIVDILLAIIQSSVTYVICSNVFYCMLAFLFIVSVIKIIEYKTAIGYAKGIVVIIIMLGVVIGNATLISKVDSYYKSGPQWDQYLEYNKYRVSFWDYPRQTYEDNPELFNSMGWSYNFDQLTMKSYFIDKKFSTENLSHIVSKHSMTDVSINKDTIIYGAQLIRELFEYSNMVAYTGLIAILLFVVNIVLCIRTGNSYVGSIIAFFSTVLLVLFLALKGRLVLRAYLVCVIPCITMLVMIGITSLEKQTGESKTVLFEKKAMKMMCMILIITLQLWGYSDVFSVYRQRYIEENRMVIAMEKYIAKHPKNIYVYDRYGARNHSVFSSYPDVNKRPINGIASGSSYVFSPSFYQQLEKNGLTQLYTEDLFKDNIYYITGSDKKNLKYLKRYLKEEYESISYKKVDEIGDDFFVYKIVNDNDNKLEFNK